MAGIGRIHVFLYVALLAGHVALVWLLPHVPTVDGPGHAYNVRLLRELKSGSQEAGRIHEESWFLSPNLGYHGVALPLSAWLPPLTVERIFLTLYLVLLTAALPLYLVSLGRQAFPLSYAAMLIPFNHSFLMGFHSYLVSIPLVLLGLAWVWRLRTRPVLTRLIASNGAATAILLVHGVGFAILLLAIGTMEFLERRNRRAMRRLAAFLLVMLPSLLLAGGWILLKGGGTAAWARTPFPYAVDLACGSMLNLSLWQIPLCLAGLTLTLVSLFPALRDLSLRKPVPEAERFALVIGGLLVAGYLAAPGEFLGGGHFPQRLPWVIFLIAMPAWRMTAPSDLGRWFAPTLIFLATTGLVLNGFLLKRESDRINLFVRGLAAELPAGATVMTARFDWGTMGTFPRYDPLTNAASYYGLRGSIHLGNHEALQSYFPLRFKAGLPSWPSSADVYRNAAAIPWERYPWPEFLLCWELTAAGEKALRSHFRPYWNSDQGSLTILKRIP